MGAMFFACMTLASNLSFIGENFHMYMFCLFYTDHVQCHFFVIHYERIWIMEMFM
jgi:hypothetical protein